MAPIFIQRGDDANVLLIPYPHFPEEGDELLCPDGRVYAFRGGEWAFEVADDEAGVRDSASA